MLYLVRYGELALKSPPVRRRFERQLARNIRRGFRDAGALASVRPLYGRFLIEAPPAAAKRVLSHTFGIVSFSPCAQLPVDLAVLARKALALARKAIPAGSSFRVETNRVGTHSFTSQDVNRAIGAVIHDTLNRPVKLGKPDVTISIDIRDKTAFLFAKTFPGPGGLPVGSAEPLLAVLDRPGAALAAWLCLRRGSPIHPVLVHASPAQAKRWLAQLQRWSPYPLKPAAIKAKRASLGQLFSQLPVTRCAAIVSAETDIAQLAAMKTVAQLPVFWPLAGLPPERIKEFAARMRR